MRTTNVFFYVHSQKKRCYSSDNEKCWTDIYINKFNKLKAVWVQNEQQKKTFFINHNPVITLSFADAIAIYLIALYL